MAKGVADSTDLALAELGVGASESPNTEVLNPDVLDEGTRVVTLPSGRVATIREGTMADLEKAQLLAGGKQQKLIPFLVTELVEIDGQKLTYEQYRALPIREGSVLMTAISAQFPEGES